MTHSAILERIHRRHRRSRSENPESGHDFNDGDRQDRAASISLAEFHAGVNLSTPSKLEGYVLSFIS